MTCNLNLTNSVVRSKNNNKKVKIKIENVKSRLEDKCKA